jgi:hypothetical protein
MKCEITLVKKYLMQVVLIIYNRVFHIKGQKRKCIFLQQSLIKIWKATETIKRDVSQFHTCIWKVASLLNEDRHLLSGTYFFDMRVGSCSIIDARLDIWRATEMKS